MNLHGPDAESTAADVQEPATTTAPFQPACAVAQRGESLIGLVAPDFTERSLLHIAQGKRLPELIGMNVTLRVDVSDAGA